MTDISDPRCFTCRQPVEEPPVLNELADGNPCPTCRDRVLDSLPSLLPSAPSDLEKATMNPPSKLVRAA